MRPDRDTARSEAILWAREIVDHPGTIYLDTETTGIGPDAEIVDIALIDRDGQRLFESLVKPSVSIPPETTAIHGIVDAMVTDAPSWPQVFPMVANVLRQARQVVIYNADFDRRIIEQATRRNLLPTVSYRAECAMRQYASFAGVWHERYGNWRWHRLDQAALSFAEGIDGHHRAFVDARLCRAIVAGMAAQPLPATRVSP